MLKIDMDNGKRYFFEDYTDYVVGDEYLIVYKGKQWIGLFELSHLIGFFVGKDEEQSNG